MGGPGGWGSVFRMSMVSPVLALFHTCLFSIVWYQNRKHGRTGGFREYQLKRGASYALLIYYAIHFAFQLFLGDGGVSFMNPGIASVVFGLSGNAADKCSAFLLGTITALMIVLLQVVCFEPKLLWMEDIAPLVQLDQPEPDGGISGNAGAGGARREYVGRLGTSAGLFDDDIVGA